MKLKKMKKSLENSKLADPSQMNEESLQEGPDLAAVRTLYLGSPDPIRSVWGVRVSPR